MSKPSMASDGKRPRPIWQPGDGDGDSDQQLFDKNQFTIKGHPTWTLFMGDVPDPIVIGKNEPPKYVYLDDKAAWDIWSSKLYSHKDMRKYWGHDFNNQGHIKQGRCNRGRPAYTDDSEKEFATAPHRGKLGNHVFSGEPEVVKYQPRRPKKLTTKPGLGERSNQPLGQPTNVRANTLPSDYDEDELSAPLDSPQLPKSTLKKAGNSNASKAGANTMSTPRKKTQAPLEPASVESGVQSTPAAPKRPKSTLASTEPTMSTPTSTKRTIVEVSFVDSDEELVISKRARTSGTAMSARAPIRKNKGAEQVGKPNDGDAVPAKSPAEQRKDDPPNPNPKIAKLESVLQQKFVELTQMTKQRDCYKNLHICRLVELNPSEALIASEWGPDFQLAEYSKKLAKLEPGMKDTEAIVQAAVKRIMDEINRAE